MNFLGSARCGRWRHGVHAHDHVVPRPQCRGDAGGHGGRHLQGLVDPDEIIMDEVDRQGVDVVLDPLAEGVGQAREAAQRHSDRQIVALDHRGRDVRWIG